MLDLSHNMSMVKKYAKYQIPYLDKKITTKTVELGAYYIRNRYT